MIKLASSTARRVRRLLTALCAAIVLASVGNAGPNSVRLGTRGDDHGALTETRGPSNTPTEALVLVRAARAQVGVTTAYDPSYVRLAYPGGDVPGERGVCTDVVIRALRDALDVDLQVLVHEDMMGAFAAYPNEWGLKRPDPNIDHRRVPNLQCYLQRAGHSLDVTENAGDYLPGDLVTCTVPRNRPHIMVVSDRKSAHGTPLVIHNIGRGTREENRLFEFPLTGHYRLSPMTAATDEWMSPGRGTLTSPREPAADTRSCGR